ERRGGGSRARGAGAPPPAARPPVLASCLSLVPPHLPAQEHAKQLRERHPHDRCLLPQPRQLVRIDGHAHYPRLLRSPPPPHPIRRPIPTPPPCLPMLAHLAPSLSLKTSVLILGRQQVVVKAMVAVGRRSAFGVRFSGRGGPRPSAIGPGQREVRIRRPNAEGRTPTAGYRGADEGAGSSASAGAASLRLSLSGSAAAAGPCSGRAVSG